MSKELRAAFKQATSEFIALIETLDENQLNEIHQYGGWSAGMIGNHIWKSYASAETMMGRTESTNREPDEKVALIRDIFTDFSIRMESPIAILPTKQRIDKARLLESLRDRVTQMLEIIDTRDLSEICLDFAIPEYGAFTGLEWAWFNTYHTLRHLRQLQDVINAIKN